LEYVALHLLLLIYQKPEGQARFACMQALALLGQIDKELSPTTLTKKFMNLRREKVFGYFCLFIKVTRLGSDTFNTKVVRFARSAPAKLSFFNIKDFC